MPILKNSSFNAPPLLNNGHFQTLYPYFFRKVEQIDYKRKRISTFDGDFLDVDFFAAPSETKKDLIILSHGLEGHGQASYIRGMAKYFNEKGIDAVSWSMRSCSGEMNRKPVFYHAGQIEDLEHVINYAKTLGKYQNIYLIGFSLGASLTAMYLGKRGNDIDGLIKSSVVFSAPCCLKSSGEELSKPIHRFYAETFLSTMRKKVFEKDKLIGLPMLDLTDLKKVKTFKDFDDRVTSKLLGLKDAQEYYDLNSCKNYLSDIKVPTLIINAKNDPFLGKDCYPIREAYKNKQVFLEMPKTGGHLGFTDFRDKSYWSEKRAESFLFEEN